MHFVWGGNRCLNLLQCNPISSLGFKGLYPVAVHIAAKSSMQKAKGVWTLQAGRVEAVLQLTRVHDQDRM